MQPTLLNGVLFGEYDGPMMGSVSVSVNSIAALATLSVLEKLTSCKGKTRYSHMQGKTRQPLAAQQLCA